MRQNFHVMHMSTADVVLGCERLHGLGSLLKCSYQHNTRAFEDHGVHVLLMGEQDVPVSLLIYIAKFTYLLHHNEIISIISCYLFPPCLSTN